MFLHLYINSMKFIYYFLKSFIAILLQYNGTKHNTYYNKLISKIMLYNTEHKYMHN